MRAQGLGGTHGYSFAFSAATATLRAPLDHGAQGLGDNNGVTRAPHGEPRSHAHVERFLDSFPGHVRPAAQQHHPIAIMDFRNTARPGRPPAIRKGKSLGPRHHRAVPRAAAAGGHKGTACTSSTDDLPLCEDPELKDHRVTARPLARQCGGAGPRRPSEAQRPLPAAKTQAVDLHGDGE